MKKEKFQLFTGSYKNPRKRKLIYRYIHAENTNEALSHMPKQISHNGKIYFFYGLS